MAGGGHLRAIAAIAVASAVALGGCGEEEQPEPISPRARADGAAALTRAVAVMQRKGTARFTMSYTSEGVPSGQKGVEAQGAGILDFRHARGRYRIRYDEAPGVDPGTTVDLFEDGSTTYARNRQGRYERQEPGLVANATADVFKYLASDTSGVHETGTKAVGGRPCTVYAGKIDFARIRARAPAARRAEFDRTSRGIRTQAFNVCIDKGDVVREYGVEVRVPGGGDFVLHGVSRFTRVGSVAPIRALRSDEKA